MIYYYIIILYKLYMVDTAPRLHPHDPALFTLMRHKLHLKMVFTPLRAAGLLPPDTPCNMAPPNPLNSSQLQTSLPRHCTGPSAKTSLKHPPPLSNGKMPPPPGTLLVNRYLPTLSGALYWIRHFRRMSSTQTTS